MTRAKTNTKIYVPRPGSGLSEEAAQTIGRYVSDLIAQGVDPTPELMVGQAKNPAHPLHDLFDWDRDRAAHAAWVDRARFLLNGYKEVQIETRKSSKATFAVQVTSKEGPPEWVHKSVNWVLRQNTAREQVLDRLLRTIRAACRDAQDLNAGADPRWRRLIQAAEAFPEDE